MTATVLTAPVASAVPSGGFVRVGEADFKVCDPSKSARSRYVTHGQRGRSGELVRLRAVRLAGSWWTRAEWVDAFLSELSK